MWHTNDSFKIAYYCVSLFNHLHFIELILRFKAILSTSALNICKQFPLTCLKNAMQQALKEEKWKQEWEKKKIDFPSILKNLNLVSQVNKYQQ